MKTPEDCNAYDREMFPHFHVFCVLQLGRPIQWGEHWENAKIIAGIEEEKLKTMCLDDYLALGMHYSR